MALKPQETKGKNQINWTSKFKTLVFQRIKLGNWKYNPQGKSKYLQIMYLIKYPKYFDKSCIQKRYKEL